ncbi:MAG: redoxin domain-containing protein [Bdellovibrionales bacterium]|nr:redoxin domain-containing protein [Bdellovibrionales bacterium]
MVAIAGLTAFSGKSTSNEIKIGSKAPAFTAKDSNGKERSLGDYKGKYVVLEWLNHGCPYVRKHYDSGNMQRTQADAKKKGAVWLSIVSSAEGKQGYMTPAETNAAIKKNKSNADAVLLDADGKIGLAYGAKTTPHMFIIDPKGTVVYQGAIDSIRSTDTDDIIKAENYVLAAFREIKSGSTIKTAATEPYGCGVKYQ